jgi:transcriptional regulator with XRE-family HTH domain
VIQELLNLKGPQGKLAIALKVSQSTISKWLSGTHEPSMAQWQMIEALYLEVKGRGDRVAKALETTPEELLLPVYRSGPPA